jgi:hypothetical protein
MKKDQAVKQKLFGGTILRGKTQCFLITYDFSLLLFYPVAGPADLSQLAKSATADGLIYSDSKKCGKF